MLLQVLVTLFVVFAVSRVWLRYKDASLGAFGMIGWTALWVLIAAVVWWPAVTSALARLVGVGRGVDAVVYLSIIIMFYGLFRLYVKMEFIERELTTLVRNLTLREGDRSKSKE